MDSKGLISADMLQQVEETAREQHRTPSEILDEALLRYFNSRRLSKLGEKLNKLAVAEGIREEDIPDLVHQMRRES